MAGSKLHLGCGRTILPGWINLDLAAGPGVDVVADLDACGTRPLPIPDDSVEEILGSHLLEHLRHPLPLLAELHRVARPGAKATFQTPYGGSDDAFEDPTHVRQYFAGSFGYFSQPYYWRADYGYRGDWQPRMIRLEVSRARFQGQSVEQIMHQVNSLRNVVLQMTAVLEAIKPIREPKRERIEYPELELTLVET
jgi:SAM-dependent methyltransferase